jgi:hypothetical protein
MGVSVLVSGCDVAPPPTITPPPSTPRSIPTLEGTRPLSVAVAVGTPTPTVPIVGDYSTLVRDRLVRVESAFKALDAQFAVLQTAPIRITQADWRNDTLARLDDLAATNDALRALGARSGADGLLYGEVSKVSSDLDFVVSEYRMAFDFDPDGSHLVRAGRAEKMTSDEVESMLLGLRRGIGPAPTLTPTPTS